MPRSRVGEALRRAGQRLVGGVAFNDEYRLYAGEDLRFNVDGPVELIIADLMGRVLLRRKATRYPHLKNVRRLRCPEFEARWSIQLSSHETSLSGPLGSYEVLYMSFYDPVSGVERRTKLIRHGRPAFGNYTKRVEIPLKLSEE